MLACGSGPRGNYCVLTLGVDDDAGRFQAFQQSRDDHARSLPRPGPGDDQGMVFRGAADGDAWVFGNIEIAHSWRAGLYEENSAEIVDPPDHRRLLGGEIGRAVVIGERRQLWSGFRRCLSSSEAPNDHEVRDKARGGNPPPQTIIAVSRGILQEQGRNEGKSKHGLEGAFPALPFVLCAGWLGDFLAGHSLLVAQLIEPGSENRS